MDRLGATSYWLSRLELVGSLGRAGAAMRRGRLGVYLAQDREVLDVCVRAASDWNEQVREAALRSLSQVADRGDQRVIDVLLLALEDFVQAVVRAALEGLQAVALESDETLMSKLCLRLQSENVRELACLALKDAGGTLRCAEAVGKLLESSAEASDRLWAGTMLARLASFFSVGGEGAHSQHNDWAGEGASEEEREQCVELLIRALARCIIDSDWNVQRMALRVLCTATDKGYVDTVHDACSPYVPLAHRGPGEVVAFVQAMAMQPSRAGDGAEGTGDVRGAEADIARVLQVYNSLRPGYGLVPRGEVELGKRALRSEATKVAGEWIPEYSVKPGDTLVVGPLRKLVQVTDVVPLDNGKEIYAKDSGGGTVYIPANSKSRDLRYALAPTQAHGSSGKRGGITTLPIFSQSTLRSLPRGRRFAPGTGLPAPRFPPRRAGGEVAPLVEDEWRDLSEDMEVRNMSARTDFGGHHSHLTSSGRSDSSHRPGSSASQEAISRLSSPAFGPAAPSQMDPSAGILDWLILSDVERISRASRASQYGGEMQSAFHQDLQRNRRFYSDPYDHNLVPPPSRGETTRIKPHPAGEGKGIRPKDATKGTPASSSAEALRRLSQNLSRDRLIFTPPPHGNGRVFGSSVPIGRPGASGDWRAVAGESLFGRRSGPARERQWRPVTTPPTAITEQATRAQLSSLIDNQRRHLSSVVALSHGGETEVAGTGGGVAKSAQTTPKHLNVYDLGKPSSRSGVGAVSKRGRAF